jgi:adenosylcobinamide kinase/adenosylcobinamide-phosphate guanylyltransferase
MSFTLVLGGARSGKSTFAERRAAESGRPVLYLATATAGDAEMAARIAAHRAARPADWRTVEAPLEPAAAIRAHARAGDLVLLDCVTLWVSNRLLADPAPSDADLVGAAEGIADAALERRADLVAVSNEVGLGVVPPYPLGRRYRDALGRVNQALAARADEAVLLVAGLPLRLKG